MENQEIIYLAEDGTKISILSAENDEYRSIESTDKKSVKFKEALVAVAPVLNDLKSVLEATKPDEVTVEFSLKSEGEAGLFKICSAKIGAEFKISATWKFGSEEK